VVSRPPPVSSFSLCDLRLFVIKRIYLSKKEVLRASLVWLGRLVPGLYEVIQYTLSALHGPAAVPPGVGAAQAFPPPAAPSAPVVQAVAVSAGAGSYAGVLGGCA